MRKQRYSKQILVSLAALDLIIIGFSDKNGLPSNARVLVATTSTDLTDDHVCLREDSHAQIHDRRDFAVQDYERIMSGQVRGFNNMDPELPDLITLQNSHYAIWNPTQKTDHSAWVLENITIANFWLPGESLTYMRGKGWQKPKIDEIDPKLVIEVDGDYAAYTG